eukprot:3768574-Alexandrium_andersonii.AAC.1
MRFTVPAREEDETHAAVEDSILNEDCDLMLAAGYERTGVAAPAETGGGDPDAGNDSEDFADPMDTKHAVKASLHSRCRCARQGKGVGQEPPQVARPPVRVRPGGVAAGEEERLGVVCPVHLGRGRVHA